MQKTRPSALIATAVLAAGLTTGCGSTRPPTFYALQPMAAAGESAWREDCGEGLAVGVGPVLTPKYLAHPEIAVVADGPEVYFSQANRWASPLEEQVGAVLTRNLAALLSTCRVAQFPWTQRLPMQYGVVVHIARFDGEPGGRAVLDAQWVVYTETDPGGFAVESVCMTQDAVLNGYAGLVAAQSELLAELSRGIAATIRKLAAADGEDGTR
jgi:uncharacterized lipoprotein YmbA